MTLQNIALGALLHQYVYRLDGSSRSKRVARVVRELDDFGCVHANTIDGPYLEISHQTVANYLYRRHPIIKYEPCISAFLESKGFLDRKWYDELNDAEECAIDILDVAPISKLSFEFDGIYLFEGSAHTESMIAYCMVVSSALGDRATCIRLIERVYHRRLAKGEQGSRYQLRMDRADSDMTYESIGYVYLSNGRIGSIFYNNHSDFDEKYIRDGQLNIKDDCIFIELSEDFVERTYKKFSQSIGKSEKITPLLNERQKSNILRRSRFLETFDYIEEYLEPIFFEERRCDFSDVDLKLLNAAEAGDAIEMVRSIVEGADINVCDPETGKTALHKVAASLSPVAACVLVPKELTSLPEYQNIMDDLYDELKGQNIGDIIDIDFALRTAQQQLNPLYLDEAQNFASRDSGYIDNFFTYMDKKVEDPIFEIRQTIENIIGTCIYRSLEKCRILPVIGNMDLEDRLAAIRGFRSKKSENLYSPRPGE